MFILLPGVLSERSLETSQRFRTGDKENLFAVQEVQSYPPALDFPFLHEFGRKVSLTLAKPCKLQSGFDSPEQGNLSKTGDKWWPSVQAPSVKDSHRHPFSTALLYHFHSLFPYLCCHLSSPGFHFCCHTDESSLSPKLQQLECPPSCCSLLTV